MLRKLILVGLIAGASGAANAQSVPSATFSQTNVHNYALIAPGTDLTEITVIQNGVTNAAVVDQLGDVNVAEVSQRAKRSNDFYVYQDGAINIAAVTQQYNFGGVGGAAPGYVGRQTAIGFLSEFNSGGVSILALTGPGSTLISNFGRTH